MTDAEVDRVLVRIAHADRFATAPIATMPGSVIRREFVGAFVSWHDETLLISRDRLRAVRDAAILEQLAGGRPIVELAHARQRTSGEIGVLRRDGAVAAICAHRANLEPLPEAIGELAALERLDVGDNRLSELPAASIGSLPRLRTLDLRGNQLDELPETLRGMALTKLDLRWNPLRARPRWLDELADRGCLVYV